MMLYGSFSKIHKESVLLNALPVRGNADWERGKSVNDLYELEIVREVFNTQSKDTIKKAIRRLIEGFCQDLNLEIKSKGGSWVLFHEPADKAGNSPTQSGREAFYRFGDKSELPKYPIFKADLHEIIAVGKFLDKTGATVHTSQFKSLANRAKKQKESDEGQKAFRSPSSHPLLLIEPEGLARKILSLEEDKKKFHKQITADVQNAINEYKQIKIVYRGDSINHIENEQIIFEEKQADIIPLSVGVKGYIKYLLYCYRDAFNKYQNSDIQEKLKIYTLDMSKISEVKPQVSLSRIKFGRVMFTEEDFTEALRFKRTIKQQCDEKIRFSAFGPIGKNMSNYPFQYANVSDFKKDECKTSNYEYYVDVEMDSACWSIDLENYLISHLHFIQIHEPQWLLDSLREVLTNAKKLNPNIF
jgi:hypothetical protein